jgi:hypothetical protein
MSAGIAEPENVGVLFERDGPSAIGIQDATRSSRRRQYNILYDDFVEAMVIVGKTLVTSVI